MNSEKRLMYNILLIFGLLGILDTLVLFLFFNVSFNLGVFLPGIVGLMIVGFSLMKLQNPNKFKLKNLKVKNLLLLIFIVWLISFVFVESLILTAHQFEPNNRGQTLLILGAGLKGEKLSPTLESRMYLGLEYLKSNPSSIVIVSGGQGPGEDITEAEAMRRFLIDRGIANSRIIKEEKSTSTFENFRFSKEVILANNKINEIVIITSDFHMFRAKMLARRVGLTPYGISSKTPYYILPNSCLREYFAILKSFILDR